MRHRTEQDRVRQKELKKAAATGQGLRRSREPHRYVGTAAVPRAAALALAVLLGLGPGTVRAAEPPAPATGAGARTITTLTGETFRRSRIVGVTPDGLSLQTETGVRKLPFSAFPEDVRREFHENPVSTANHETRKAAAQQARQAAALSLPEETPVSRRFATELAAHETRLEQDRAALTDRIQAIYRRRGIEVDIVAAGHLQGAVNTGSQNPVPAGTETQALPIRREDRRHGVSILDPAAVPPPSGKTGGRAVFFESERELNRWLERCGLPRRYW